MSSDNLQLEGGDFIIRFGPSMTFVLHREVLMAKSPHFHALLSDHWHIATRVEKQDNEEIAIGEDDLYFDTEAGIVELCQLDEKIALEQKYGRTTLGAWWFNP